MELSERLEIEKLLKHGFSANKIAGIINVSESRVQKEVSKNGGPSKYVAEAAQVKWDEARTSEKRRFKESIDNCVKNYGELIKKMVNEEKPIFEVMDVTGANYMVLKLVYRRLGLPNPTMSGLIEDLFLRIENLEKTISNQGKNNDNKDT